MLLPRQVKFWTSLRHVGLKLVVENVGPTARQSEVTSLISEVLLSGRPEPLDHLASWVAEEEERFMRLVRGEAGWNPLRRERQSLVLMRQIHLPDAVTRRAGDQDTVEDHGHTNMVTTISETTDKISACKLIPSHEEEEEEENWLKIWKLVQVGPGSRVLVLGPGSCLGLRGIFPGFGSDLRLDGLEVFHSDRTRLR